MDESVTAFDPFTKSDNSMFLSKINQKSIFDSTIKPKKKNKNEIFLEEQICKLKKEKPIWLKKSLISKLKENGANVESNYILKVI